MFMLSIRKDVSSYFVGATLLDGVGWHRFTKMASYEFGHPTLFRIEDPSFLGMRLSYFVYMFMLSKRKDVSSYFVGAALLDGVGWRPFTKKPSNKFGHPTLFRIEDPSFLGMCLSYFVYMFMLSIRKDLSSYFVGAALLDGVVWRRFTKWRPPNSGNRPYFVLKIHRF